MALPTLELRFTRPNKTYHPGDSVEGTVVFFGKQEFRHDGVQVRLDGAVHIHLSPKNTGMLDAMANTSRAIPLVSEAIDLLQPGRLAQGTTEIPFQLVVKPKGGGGGQGSSSSSPVVLPDSYHGVYLAVEYHVVVVVRRTFPNKHIEKVQEFVLESLPGSDSSKVEAQAVTFTISPESVKSKDKHRLPKFCIKGRIDSIVCKLSEPLTGELEIVSCSEPIKSVELQLVRVETCGGADTGFTRDATEIQNIQIGDGDVPRKIGVPIYMIFPRLFACPTLATPQFKIEFLLNVIVVFDNDHMISESFPLRLYRG